MKFRSPEGVMTDAWHLNHNDRIHYFHLKTTDDQSELLPSVGHCYTDDLLHFTVCDDILPQLPKEEYPEDCLQKYTGCAITSKDGTHYIYYTMRNENEAQKIGVALTKDLENFTLCQKNPVLVPDSEIFYYGDGSGYEDCRDMLVVEDEKTGVYYGYFAAMVKEGERKFGAIGVAKSCDLINWGEQTIAFKCDFDGAVEVPDVFCIDGKWYLTMLTHSCFGSRYIFSDKNVLSGTLYAVADSPEGPFFLGEDNVFIGGTHESGYTCRSFDYKGEKYLSYIDKSQYGWSISLPKTIKVVENNLRPCYTAILEKLRKRIIVSDLSQAKLEKQPSTCFWHLGSGEVLAENDKVMLKCRENSFQTYMIEKSENQGAEIVFDITLYDSEGGAVIETTDANGKKMRYFAVASVTDKSFSVYKGATNFSPFCKRYYNFESATANNIRIFAFDGIIEVYVNDLLLIQNTFESGEEIKVGLYSGLGNCVLENFSVYELDL